MGPRNDQLAELCEVTSTAKVELVVPLLLLLLLLGLVMLVPMLAVMLEIVGS